LGAGGQKPATLPADRKPIDFLSFLDFPKPADATQSEMRSSLLWHALKSSILDAAADMPLPLMPTRAALAEKARDAAVSARVPGTTDPIPNLGGALDVVLGPRARETLHSAIERGLELAEYPATPPRIGAFLPAIGWTEGLRTAFADAAWRAYMAADPLAFVLEQTVSRGSLFRGDDFLSTIDGLLKEKLDQAREVQFSDLPIPLAVFATNVSTRKMVVYSERSPSPPSVAEAVRRSMSIPFVFRQRRQRTGPRPNDFEEFMDGGLCSNFPAWLMTEGAKAHWPDRAFGADYPRPVVGLDLDDSLAPPSGDEWRDLDDPAYDTAGGPIDTWQVLGPQLVAKLQEMSVLPSPLQLAAGLTAPPTR
jgi:hypothetical protein